MLGDAQARLGLWQRRFAAGVGEPQSTLPAAGAANVQRLEARRVERQDWRRADNMR